MLRAGVRGFRLYESQCKCRKRNIGSRASVKHTTVAGLESSEEHLHFSHVVQHRGLLFLSGVTGTDSNGQVAPEPEVQFREAFRHLRQHLEAAGADLGDVIELTSYHVDLRRHLDSFVAVKDREILAPYPAWTAIGVSELITPGTLVELRAVARAPRKGRNTKDT
jgi:enamine deaminase RidA (YjgF/YER057c/UK114 family)